MKMCPRLRSNRARLGRPTQEYSEYFEEADRRLSRCSRNLGRILSARPRSLASLLVFGIFLWSGRASAQSSDTDADAERLFREGQKLMEAHRFGEACPKFEGAYQKDQQLGTLLNLAYCHKEQGAVWQSWLEFRQAELKAIALRLDGRRDFARARMVELEKLLAPVVIDPSKDLVLTAVLVEDRQVPDAESGSPFAAEPGQRRVTFRAKGKKDVVQLVTIVKGGKAQHLGVPPMQDEARASKSEAEPPPAALPATSDFGRPQRTVGLVLSGIGVVGLAVGSVFGIMTLGGNECNDGKVGCSAGARDELSQKAAVSTISFVAGGALLLGGGALWLTAPSAKPRTTVGGVARGARTSLVVPEIGAGWAGVRGVF